MVKEVYDNKREIYIKLFEVEGCFTLINFSNYLIVGLKILVNQLNNIACRYKRLYRDNIVE
jgi:hypothetical protein